MKAYETPAKVTAEGKVELPEEVLALLPRDQLVRLIILVPEVTDQDEDAAWSRLAEEQFLAGYSQADAIYDRV